MSKKRKFNEQKVMDVINKFNSLSEEDQKAIIKNLMYYKVGIPYIQNRLEDKMVSMMLEFDGESFQSCQQKEIKRVSGAIDTFVDKIVYGDDKALSDRVVKKYILSIKKDVSNSQKELEKERNKEN